MGPRPQSPAPNGFVKDVEMSGDDLATPSASGPQSPTDNGGQAPATLLTKALLKDNTTAAMTHTSEFEGAKGDDITQTGLGSGIKTGNSKSIPLNQQRGEGHPLQMVVRALAEVGEAETVATVANGVGQGSASDSRDHNPTSSSSASQTALVSSHLAAATSIDIKAARALTDEYAEKEG